jgi:hypothetical protein
MPTKLILGKGLKALMAGGGTQPRVTLGNTNWPYFAFKHPSKWGV